jgi:hypothetical protein
MDRKKTRIFRTALVLGVLICTFFCFVARAEADVKSNSSDLLAYHPRGSNSELRFTPNAKELAIAEFMRRNPNQQRRHLRFDPILSKIAQERAEDMGRRGYFGHISPDGLGANHLVQQAGYALPSFYGQSPSANNIESIAAGQPTPETVWNRWMNSAGHRTHLLGLSDFWADQTDYGIGYAYVAGSPHLHYWVVLTGRH